MKKTIYDKKGIRNYVKSVIADKIQTLEKFVHFTKEASKDIKKTPKYDSVREEAHEEIYQMQRQLAELHKLQNGMARVLNSEMSVIQLGSLVITNKARFYISVSLGEFFFEGDRMYAISEESPMAKMMIGKKVGDEFVLNRIHQKIEEIY
ncbi:Transcription elongation factor GreA [Elizabethkingia miricola]|nr:Transcription elongation factor GreA [Elizabethkingia miricola]